MNLGLCWMHVIYFNCCVVFHVINQFIWPLPCSFTCKLRKSQLASHVCRDRQCCSENHRVQARVSLGLAPGSRKGCLLCYWLFSNIRLYLFGLLLYPGHLQQCLAKTQWTFVESLNIDQLFPKVTALTYTLSQFLWVFPRPASLSTLGH